MPVFSLVLWARSERVERISVDEQHIWLTRIKCNSCSEVFPKEVGISRQEKVEMDKQHSFANLAARCKNCERKGYITIVEPSPYQVQPNEDGNVKGVLVSFECRGLEVIDVPLGEYFKVKALDSPAEFDEADFSDLWAEYDDNLGELVQVEEQKTEIVRAKEK